MMKDIEAPVSEWQASEHKTAATYCESESAFRSKSTFTSKPKCCVLWFLGVLALIGAIVGVAVTVMGSDDDQNTTIEKQDRHSNCRRMEELPWDENNVRRLQTQSPFQGIGCFRFRDSLDQHAVRGETQAEKAKACSDVCLTFYFGVSNFTCACYVEAPQERLTIGSCGSVTDECDVNASERMELYFKPGFDNECNQELTSTVRNFLVEEDDAPFGYDIVRNEFRASPFELYKDECGTNIYEVQTQFTDESSSLKTSVKEITEFAKEQRSSLSQSISTSASATYNGLFVKASAKVSASFDREQNALFKSSGAKEVGSKVFTSVGVKRLAEVTLVDFNNKRNFVTFSPQFGQLLRNYKKSEFSKDVAAQIFQTYGMFVMTRGMFGGYIQLRTTAKQSDISRFFSSEEDARKCYEASVEGKASGFGFSGSFDVGVGQCTEEAASQMENLQKNYASESSEQLVVGGTTVGGEFIVSPQHSTLLTTKDKYPEGDSGIQLRILSDFLSPAVVSPVEVKRFQLTEEDFSNIQKQLQSHILEELQEVEGILYQCGNCTVPYLEEGKTGFHCQCYEPSLPTIAPLPPIATYAGTYDAQAMYGGNNGVWGNGSGGTLTISEQGTIVYNDVPITEFEFDPEEKRLQWEPHGDMKSGANIAFFDVKTSAYHFKDFPSNTAQNGFTGAIMPQGSGPLDFRGFLKNP